MSDRIHVEVQGGSQPRKRGGGLGTLLMVPGIGFIVLGVLVLVVPDLLKVMVAVGFIMVGLGFVFGGLRLRRAQRQIAAFEQQFTSGSR